MADDASRKSRSDERRSHSHSRHHGGHRRRHHRDDDDERGHSSGRRRHRSSRDSSGASESSSSGRRHRRSGHSRREHGERAASGERPAADAPRRAAKRGRSPPASHEASAPRSRAAPAREVSVKLTDDDFYARAKEFRAWLVVSGNKKFGDLPGDEAHRLFGEFAKLWNAGGLPGEFYDGSFDADLADTGRTSFKWGFAAKLGADDQDSLLRLRDTVQAETDKDGTLLDAMSAARAQAARKQRKREAWERHEAERQAKDRAEYEAAVETSQAAVARAKAEADAAAIASKPEPTANELLSKLGLKPGDVVTMRPRED